MWKGASGSVDGWGTMLQAERLWKGRWIFNWPNPASRVYKTEINGRGDPLRWQRDTL
jgi:hypothetical protein